MNYISQANVSGTTYGLGLPNVYINNKGNFNIETSTDLGNTSKGKINIEAMDDIQLKPGDDISLYSHHRTGKEDEVAVKILNGAEATVNGTKQSDYPVDLQLNAANLRITTKDKDTYITNENIKRQADGKENTSDAANIFNVEVKTGGGNPEYGYLKVRAQAVDLRCEEHGGIALQPKGFDGDNKSSLVEEFITVGAHINNSGGSGLEGILVPCTAIKAIQGVEALYYTWKIKVEGGSGAIKVGATSDDTFAFAGPNTVEVVDGEATLSTDLVSYLQSTGEWILVAGLPDTSFEIPTKPESVKLYKYTPKKEGMNKIKFEHGGGDGLEFGTFNTDKTSIFTNEYRFNKDGVWKMATRVEEASDKADSNDATTAKKYTKQDDDFYDVISTDDVQTTTKDIIKTANALNTKDGIHTEITSKGNLEIASIAKWQVVDDYSGGEPGLMHSMKFDLVSISSTLKNGLDALTIGTTISRNDFIDLCGNKLTEDDYPAADEEFCFSYTTEASGLPQRFVKMVPVYETPNINIESDKNISLKATGKLSLKGILDFGSNFDFGETDEGITTQYKLTAKNKTKDCGVLQVLAFNNHASNSLTIAKSIYTPASGGDAASLDTANATITAGKSQVVASCPIIDIIRLVNYMKYNNQGPWDTQQ